MALLLPLSLLAACGDKPPPTAAPAVPKLVRTLVVDTAANDVANRYSGEVRARHESTLGFRVGGKLVERLVDAGARVKAGQALARLDPADAQLAASAAEAAGALAAADLKRSQELKERNFISQAALDARATAAQAAAAQAALARNQAKYTTLVADADGVVAAVLAEPGQVVAAGQGVFRLARDGEREVAISIPENRLAGLKVGAGATVSLWAGQADGEAGTFRGVLRELAPAADSATRTFAARVRIVAVDGAETAGGKTPQGGATGMGSIALGMTATASFARAGDDLPVVPLSAIIQQGNAATVWVVGKDDTVAQRPIEVARYGDAGVVVKSGLAAGERIVAAGAHKLSPGEKVRVAAK